MATGPTWSKPRCPGEFPGFWTSVRIDSGGKFITCMGGMWPPVGIRIPIIGNELFPTHGTSAGKAGVPFSCALDYHGG